MPVKKTKKDGKDINVNFSFNKGDKKENICEPKESCKSKCHHGPMGGCAYFLGVIGSAVYFISQTHGFWNIVLAILKALVWPAFIVYGALKALGL